jgi:hypothetical protein
MYSYILFIMLIIVVIGLFYYTNNKSEIKEENFENLENIKTFMVRDLKTNLWLNINNDGFGRFYGSGFGFNFMISKNPDEFLPLRSANNPNDYLIATTNGNDDFRIVSNPGSDLLKIQVMNFEGRNILGYTNNSETDSFISVDQAGYIHTVKNPNEASIINTIFT